MRLIHHNQIPGDLFNELLVIVISRQLIHACDPERRLPEGIAVHRGVNPLWGENLKTQSEF